jgi:hypothetical protein
MLIIWSRIRVRHMSLCTAAPLVLAFLRLMFMRSVTNLSHTQCTRGALTPAGLLLAGPDVAPALFLCAWHRCAPMRRRARAASTVYPSVLAANNK